MPVTEITLDTVKPRDYVQEVHGRQGDTDITIRAAICEDDVPCSFKGKVVRLTLIRPCEVDWSNAPVGDELIRLADQNWVQVDCEVIGNSNVVEVTLPEEATAYSGHVELAYFLIKDAESDRIRSTSETFHVWLEPSGTAEARLSPYSDQLDKLIREAEEIIEAWKLQMAAQQAAYEKAEADRYKKYEAAEADRESRFKTAESTRQSTFEKNEKSRSDAFTAAEAERKSTFERNEATRSETFTRNEAAREEQSAAATDRANSAAGIVEEAFQGNFGPSIEAWVAAHLNQDEELGLFGFQAWQAAYANLPNTEATDAEIDAVIELIGAD